MHGTAQHTTKYFQFQPCYITGVFHVLHCWAKKFTKIRMIWMKRTQHRSRHTQNDRCCVVCACLTTHIEWIGRRSGMRRISIMNVRTKIANNIRLAIIYFMYVFSFACLCTLRLFCTLINWRLLGSSQSFTIIIVIVCSCCCYYCCWFYHPSFPFNIVLHASLLKLRVQNVRKDFNIKNCWFE